MGRKTRKQEHEQKKKIPHDHPNSTKKGPRGRQPRGRSQEISVGCIPGIKKRQFGAGLTAFLIFLKLSLYYLPFDNVRGSIHSEWKKNWRNSSNTTNQCHPTNSPHHDVFLFFFPAQIRPFSEFLVSFIRTAYRKRMKSSWPKGKPHWQNSPRDT